ncbi:MAG TPA: hypothetical protein VM433_04750 [Mycobacteriales bacterium]|nr:hypothetical protein [Mycobacteriales bacterium]
MRSLLLTLPLLLVLPACAGGDGEPTLEERREAYVEQAEEVCVQSNQQVQELGTPGSVAEVPAAADRAVEIVRTTVDQITALDPPEEDRPELTERVLDPLRDDVGVAEAYAEEVKAAAAAGDGATLLRLVQERPQTSADLDFMREYGFDQCVRAADQQG